jgi:potassium/hydrogen antiporter
MDGFAWLSQSGMFLLLGLLATPHELVPVAAPALVLSLALMFVVRPLAVWLTLLPFRFSAREILFIGWVGLRGAVPIVLALFPLLAGIPGSLLVFNVAFVVVLTSLLIQGTTISLAARRFGVRLPPRAEPANQMQLAHADTHAVEFFVASGSGMVGADLRTMELPPETIASAVLREGRLLRVEDGGTLRAGDSVAFVASERGIQRLSDLFAGPQRGRRPVTPRFYGEFVLDGSVSIGDVCSIYAPGARPEQPDLTVDEVIRSRLPRPVEGDAVQVHTLEMTVREMDDSRIVRVGLRLPRVHAPSAAPPPG